MCCYISVTGVNIHVITPIVCMVCVFYTCVVCQIATRLPSDYGQINYFFIFFLCHLKGGLKAVVWTDVVQTFSMFGALILVAVKGTIDLGGPNIIFENAWNSGRIEAPM